MKIELVSITIPVHNEEDNLRVLTQEIDHALAASGQDYEVLYVDDASTDGSLTVLRQLAMGDPRIRVLALTRRVGQSGALAHAFEAARGEVVVTLDADLQNDPADIPRMLAALEDLDMVIGVRTTRHDNWLRRLSSRVANAVRGRILGDGALDTGCALKVMRRKTVARLPAFNGMHRFLPALVRMEGGQLAQVPVRHRPRLHGKPKYNVRNRLGRGVVDLLGVLWMQHRWVPRQPIEEVELCFGRRSGSPSVSSVKPFSLPDS
ncbi:MAG: glycosyltransferase family 2 protein, partial [Acidobacteriota bacterium]|nr:glycosyltransferase family 2 protein [Acidobacteriota bacterium]